MSKLALENGDDHPEAASRHLLDAAALLASQRPDGAAYLSGYVVECSLKTLFQLETRTPLKGHFSPKLHQQVSLVASVAGARTARYLGTATKGILSSPIAAWAPDLRYQAPSISTPAAQQWHAAAEQVFHETITQMRLDGEL